MLNNWFVYSLLIMPFISGAQSWNPFVSNSRMVPVPLLPSEFNGSGVFSFTLGNSGSTPLKYILNQEMTLIITLSYGIPDFSDPVKAISGSWSGKFNWKYDPVYSSFYGKQKEEIPPNSEGTISLPYKVSRNSQESNPLNGFNVNLQPPPYSNGYNRTDDDNISFYTFVEARDYGDAPPGYGYAFHKINIYRNPETGEYENYIFLGTSVDPESGYLSSADAQGDDNNRSDDEDGVIFPCMIPGDTITVPVRVTVHDYGFGALNAWLDWNRDGDFLDAGEKVAGPVSVFETGTVTLTIAVPDSADTVKPTFARFTLGNNKTGSQGEGNAWGEVEDYQVVLQKKNSLYVSGEVISDAGQKWSGPVTLGEKVNIRITAINKGKTDLNNIVISNDRIIPGIQRCLTLAPDDSCVLTGICEITKADAEAGMILLSIRGESADTEPVVCPAGVIILVQK